jgi:hypothetical protein
LTDPNDFDSVCIASLVRFQFLDYTLLLEDPPWAAVSISTWANVETNLAIIIACIPTLRPLVAKFWPRLLESSSEGDVEGYSPPPSVSSPPRRGPSSEMEQRC